MSGQKNIMIVDDDVISLDIVSFMFEKKGYSVERCADGFAAVESAIKSKPDLIIVDLMMPNLSGADTVKQMREKRLGDVPIIAFPKGIGANIQKFIQDVKPNALGLDQQFNPAWVAENLQPRITVQGNLDPICLLAGGKLLENTAKHILDTLSHKPFIFNLGHGIHKDTPIDHVENLIKIIKEY